jgi:hypothetical protein
MNETKITDDVKTSEEMNKDTQADTIDEAEKSNTADGVEVTDGANKRPKGKLKKKLWIITGVLCVVIVAAAAGFWVWHEQPGFCNAICHSPMDSYVENYYGGDTTLCVTAHQTAEVTCLECHDSSIGQQLNEGQLWLTGNFSDPPSVRRFGTADFCNRCHDDGNAETGIDKADIIKATENYQDSGRNPHDNHLTKTGLNCYSCHSVHRESKLYCTQCHDNLSTPETWRKK